MCCLRGMWGRDWRAYCPSGWYFRSQHRIARLGGTRRQSKKHGFGRRVDGLGVIHWPYWTHHLLILPTQGQPCRMFELREQATRGKRQVPTLRQRVGHVKPWLVLLGGGLVCVAIDLARPPSRQVSAWVLIQGVRTYQRLGRPIVVRWVRCRYVPSCSEYAVEALRAYGSIRGTTLAVRRIVSCTRDVAMGTVDPVPGTKSRLIGAHQRQGTSERWDSGSAACRDRPAPYTWSRSGRRELERHGESWSARRMDYMP